MIPPLISEIDSENVSFWSELCGSWLARSVGADDASPESLERFDQAYFRMYPYLLPLVDRLHLEGRRVLEIGLGYGSLGQELARRSGEYHGIDIAREPVALMSLRLARLGLRNLAHQGSALALPFPDASFDAVISIGVLHHTGDLPRAIAEVRRVLAPGGVAFLMVYNKYSLRRLLLVPRIRLAARFGHTAGYPNADARIRALYDSSSDGSAAPATVFTSTRGLRRLLRGFSSVHLELHNIDDYRRLPRARLLGTVDRVAGLDIYAVARV